MENFNKLKESWCLKLYLVQNENTKGCNFHLLLNENNHNRPYQILIDNFKNDKNKVLKYRIVSEDRLFRVIEHEMNKIFDTTQIRFNRDNFFSNHIEDYNLQMCYLTYEKEEYYIFPMGMKIEINLMGIKLNLDI